jgi:uncharacterized protein YndB with AHSA1/START domain
MSSTNHVTASRRVESPAAAVFALLSDPGRHSHFDGSGMLVDLVTPGILTSVGNVFTMRMHNDFLGDYTIDNHVVEFDPERRIAWEPVLKATSREEAKPNIGHNLHHRWGYELEAVGPTATFITEFFDCSRSSEEWQEDLQEDMQSWMPAAMAASLEKIEHLISDD